MHRSLLDDLERDRSLDDPARWRERFDMLDRLELCIFEEGDRRRAEAVKAHLESLNDALYRHVREAIRQGAGASAVSDCMRNAVDDDADSTMAADGYDHLDELISGVLQFGQPDDASIEQPPEMVFYQPTPVRHILDLIRRTGLNENDVLMDLGAGLGHVALLASICSGAPCVGIERELAYVECFRRSAESLQLSRATAIQQDAREADFSHANVFYLYAPFTGSVMRAVLDKLRNEAVQRQIRIATYGPCTSIVSGESWLESMGVVNSGRIAVLLSRH